LWWTYERSGENNYEASLAAYVHWHVAGGVCFNEHDYFLWSGNVRRIAFGDMLDRVMYAAGAAIGCAIGVIISTGLTQ
jgi:hypothetical protein